MGNGQRERDGENCEKCIMKAIHIKNINHAVRQGCGIRGAGHMPHSGNNNNMASCQSLGLRRKSGQIINWLHYGFECHKNPESLGKVGNRVRSV